MWNECKVHFIKIPEMMLVMDADEHRSREKIWNAGCNGISKYGTS